MIAVPFVRRAFAALALPFALAFAACDDATDPNPEDFDAEATADQLDALVVSADVEGDPFQALVYAQGWLGVMTGAPVLMDRPSSAPISAAAMQATAAAAQAGAIIPDSLYGRTYVYNATSNQYEWAPDSTGAPADGVVFLFYAMNPVTHVPAEPLNRLGFIELRDLSTQTSVRLGIRVVDTSGATDVTYADYYVDASFAATTLEMTFTRDAVGYLSNGQKELEFNLSNTFVLSSTGPSSLDFDYSFEVPDDDVQVSFDFGAESAGQTEEPESGRVIMSIAHGNDSVVLDADVEGETLDGDIRFNGIVVVLISGNANNPTFTRPGGGELTLAQILALHRFHSGIGRLLELAEHIFGSVGAEVEA